MNAKTARKRIIDAASECERWNPDKATVIQAANDAVLAILQNIPETTADEIATVVYDRFTSELARIEANND